MTDYTEFPIPTAPAENYVDGRASALIAAQRNPQQDDALYRILLDVLGPDAPAPYVLDQASPSYPHTDRGDFARLGGAWQWDRNRKLVEVGADVRRDSFDPETGAYRGRLYEPERENYLNFAPSTGNTSTQKIAGSGYAGTDTLEVTVLSDGNARHVRWTYSTGVTEDRQFAARIAVRSSTGQVGLSSNITDPPSVFASIVSGPGSVSGSSNVRIIGGLDDVEWTVIDVYTSGDYSGDSLALYIYIAVGGDVNGVTAGDVVEVSHLYGTFDVDGDVERLGTFIAPPDSGTTTRPPDLATYPLGDWFDPSEGTFVVAGAFTAPDENRSAILSYGGSTSADRSFISINRVDDTWAFGLRENFGSVSFSEHPYVDGRVECLAITWSGSAYQGAVSGAVIDERPSSVTWPDSDPIRLGSSLASGNTGYASGGYALAMYLPARLSETQLTTLTTALQTLYGGS